MTPARLTPVEHAGKLREDFDFRREVSMKARIGHGLADARPRVLTVRTRPEQMPVIRALLDRQDGAACQLPGTTR